jgi:hypothetical protein
MGAKNHISMNNLRHIPKLLPTPVTISKLLPVEKINLKVKV